MGSGTFQGNKEERQSKNNCGEQPARSMKGSLPIPNLTSQNLNKCSQASCEHMSVPPIMIRLRGNNTSYHLGGALPHFPSFICHDFWQIIASRSGASRSYRIRNFPSRNYSEFLSQSSASLRRTWWSGPTVNRGQSQDHLDHRPTLYSLAFSPLRNNYFT